MAARRNERVGLRRVFENPGYRRLWSARTASQWGDVFATVALSLLVLELTGSAWGVATVVLVEIIPVIAFAPFAGALVDRLPRASVMVVADLARAVLSAFLVLFHDDVSVVYAVAFGSSVCTVLFNPAANGALPDLVSDRHLVAANSGIWTAAVLSQIAIAPVAGVLYTAFGPGPAFAINGLSYLVSAAVLVGLQLPPTPAITSRRQFFTDAGAGVRLVTSDPLLRALAVGQLLAALSAGATSALLVVLAREHLSVEPSGYGWLLAAIGVGAVIGPLLLTGLVDDARRPAYVFGPYLLRGGVDFVIATVSSLPVAMLAMAAYGLGTSSGAVTFNSLLQSSTSEGVRGRVFAAFDLLWQLGRLISIMAGGALASAVGIEAVYYIGGSLLVLAAAVGWRAARTTAA